MKQLSKETLENIPSIDLGDIKLRKISIDDYKDMYEYASDDEVTKTLSFNSHKNEEESKETIKKFFLTRSDNGTPAAHAIVDKSSGKMIGTCDVFKVNWENEVCEIGYVINRNYWGKGYMTLACRAVMNFAFEYLKLSKIEIGHYKDNIGSQRVIEKCGFNFVKEEYEEKFDQFIRKYELSKKDYMEINK